MGRSRAGPQVKPSAVPPSASPARRRLPGTRSQGRSGLQRSFGAFASVSSLKHHAQATDGDGTPNQGKAHAVAFGSNASRGRSLRDPRIWWGGKTYGAYTMAPPPE